MQLALFDLDGTLVDSSAVILESQRRTFLAHGLPVPSTAAMLSVVGLTLPQAFEAHVGAAGPYEAMAETYRGLYHALREEPAYAEPLFAGARETVDRLRARPDVLLGVATGKGRAGALRLIGREGWLHHFITVQTADDAASKPSPEMIFNAARESGVPPARIAMIGDSTHDMRMARAAGARAIGVSWGFMPREALIEAGAEIVLNSFAEIDPLFRAAA